MPRMCVDRISQWSMPSLVPQAECLLITYISPCGYTGMCLCVYRHMDDRLPIKNLHNICFTHICMYGVHVPHVKSYQASTYCVEHLMPGRALVGCEYNLNKEYYSTVCTIELPCTYTPKKLRTKHK